MSTPAHVTFFLLPGFNLAALGAAAGVLAEEARHIPFTTIGLDGAPVSASCSIALRPDRRAEEMAAETAILIILAGRDQEAETVEAALVVLRRARRRGPSTPTSHHHKQQAVTTSSSSSSIICNSSVVVVVVGVLLGTYSY